MKSKIDQGRSPFQSRQQSKTLDFGVVIIGRQCKKNKKFWLVLCL